MLSFKAETITPQQASDLLERSSITFKNRNVTPSFVKRYIQDMKSGNWHADTGETLKIDIKGRVIDGQHRLQAIVQADIDQRMWVCRGIETEMFQYIDQGKTRDLKDIMTVEEWPDPRILHVTGKMLWRYEKTLERTGKGAPYAHAGSFNESDGAIYDWLQNVRPGLRSVWESYKGVVLKAYKGSDRAIPESLLLYVLYQWHQNNSDLTLDIFTYLGEPMNQASPHDACGWALKYCQKLRQAQKETGVGGTTGRHADAKESMLTALSLMWDIMNGRESVRSWTSFKRRVADDGAFAVVG